MFFAWGEIIDIVIMSAALGFIFGGFIKKPQKYNADPLLQLRRGFNWEDFLFAMAVVAPAVILHEFGHKFVAMGFGAFAVFNAAYFWLGLGIIMKLMSQCVKHRSRFRQLDRFDEIMTYKMEGDKVTVKILRPEGIMKGGYPGKGQD